MSSTRWTWCPKCMVQTNHEVADDGLWCLDCGTPNSFSKVSNAIHAVAEKELEKEKKDNGRSSTSRRNR